MAPDKIGRYEIERELGRGGMAVVFLGRDPYMKRQVAVKVLPAQFTNTPELRARFQREAEIIAALEHSAIVPVYDYGEHEDQPFIVMRYMPGGSLADRLGRGPLALSATAAVLNRIGSALDRAHTQGIIHRDLKPGNILFDQYNDAYLSDFGIARLSEASVALTGSGVIGTPAYMSPEQVYGDVALDGRSDIYALGVILFEMLTGQIPYHADTPAKLMLKHILEPVPRIQEVKPDLPPGCEAMISRAMAKDRDQRFATASDLAQQITVLAPTQPAVTPPLDRPAESKEKVEDQTSALLTGPKSQVSEADTVLAETDSLESAEQQPAAGEAEKQETELALPPTPAKSAAPTAVIAAQPVASTPALPTQPRPALSIPLPKSRRGWAITGIAALFLAGIVLLTLRAVLSSGDEVDTRFSTSIIASNDVNQEPDDEEVVAEEPTEEEPLTAEESTEDTTIIEPTKTPLFTGEADEPADSGLAELAYTEVVRLGRGSADTIRLSPDGELLAVGGTLGIWLYEADSLEPIKVITGHADRVTALTWSPDGRKLASSSFDSTIRVWDVESGRELLELDGRGNVILSVDWSPDGQYLAAGSWNTEITIWDAGSGETVQTLQGHTAPIHAVAWAPDSQYLASGGEEENLYLWDALSGEQVQTLKHGDWVFSLAWQPQGNDTTLAAGQSDGQVKLWDTNDGTLLHEWQAHEYGLRGLAWSPDGARLATSGNDGLLHLWNASSVEVEQSWHGPNTIIDMAWQTEGAQLFGLFIDGDLRLWDIAADETVAAVEEEHYDEISTVAWSPDGALLAGGVSNHAVLIWDAASSELRLSLNGYTSESNGGGLAWAPDGSLLAVTYSDLARIWDTATAERTGSLSGSGSYVNGLSWSPDSSELAVVGWDNIVRIYDVVHEEVRLAIQDAVSVGVTWSPDGRFLAGNDNNSGTIKVWDSSDGARVQILEGHTDQISQLAWSPDGTILASASADGTVVLWSTNNWEPMQTLGNRGSNALTSLAWTPNGRYLATGTWSGIIYIFDIQADSTQPLGYLSGHVGPVRSLDWFPDGEYLASGGNDGTVRVWQGE